MKRLALVAVLVVAGCGGSGEDTFDARIALVVPDNNLREEGIECAGARPFRVRCPALCPYCHVRALLAWSARAFRPRGKGATVSVVAGRDSCDAADTLAR